MHSRSMNSLLRDLPLAGAASALLCAQVLGQAEVKITGVVRDFQQSHVDMNVFPVGGTGHYAGNVAYSLDPSTKVPTFSGAGFRVAGQWLDDASRPIPPHLYMFTSGNSVHVVNAPTLDAGAYMDSWDSNLGPYGGANIGPAPTINTGSIMPAVWAPNDLGPSLGNVFFGGSDTINTNIHCDNFTTKKDITLTIQGDVTILCEGNFQTGQRNVILLAPSSRLRLYFRGTGLINQQTQINMNTMDPNACVIYNLGTSDFDFNQNTDVCARIISPAGKVVLHQSDELYGSFLGLTLESHQNSALHNDNADFLDICGAAVDDTVGVASVSSSGGIDSAASYHQWYTDDLGVNYSVPHRITLTDNGSGVYEYHSDAFYPIDGRLFGNEGQSHNHYFTFMFSAYFQYNACSDQYFSFEGADDCWVFVDNKLGIDLGGILPGQEQILPMGRMNLVDGQVYELRFFYAQRNGNTASMHIATNVQLVNSLPGPMVSAGFD